MGKNSLLKSTTKKEKASSKKKDEELKAQKTKAAKKAKTPAKTKAAPKAKAAVKAKKTTKAKAAPKKATPKKTTVKAKKTTKAKAAPKKTASKKAAVKARASAKKAAPPRKKKVSVKELVQKKFAAWEPDELFTVSPDKAYLENFTAPPFAAGSEDEVKQIKKLLLKKFDLEEIKTAAEKMPAEKADVAKEAEPEASVTYGPPDDGDTLASDPMGKAGTYLVAVFVVLVSLVIGASIINNNTYSIDAKEGALEIWQGNFSPMGEELLITLPGVQPPETTKDSYSKSDVFPIILNYYVGKSDTLLEVPGMPDFEGIKTYLNKALPFANTNDYAKAVYTRLNNIEVMILQYKAEVAASKATIADLEAAKGHLTEASRLDLDDLRTDLINQKIEAINASIAALEAQQAEVEAETPAQPAETPAQPVE